MHTLALRTLSWPRTLLLVKLRFALLAASAKIFACCVQLGGHARVGYGGRDGQQGFAHGNRCMRVKP